MSKEESWLIKEKVTLVLEEEATNLLVIMVWLWNQCIQARRKAVVNLYGVCGLFVVFFFLFLLFLFLSVL